MIVYTADADLTCTMLGDYQGHPYVYVQEPLLWFNSSFS